MLVENIYTTARKTSNSSSDLREVMIRMRNEPYLTLKTCATILTWTLPPSTIIHIMQVQP